MREALAWAVCVAALGLVTLLSYLFGVRHNPASPEAKHAAPTEMKELAKPIESARVEDSGEAVFKAQKCQTCHSIGGAGNPRYPLDGAGSRLNPEELRARITGTGSASEKLPTSIRKRKARYAQLSEEEMNKLAHYLSRTNSKTVKTQ